MGAFQREPSKTPLVSLSPTWGRKAGGRWSGESRSSIAGHLRTLTILPLETHFSKSHSHPCPSPLLFGNCWESRVSPSGLPGSQRPERVGTPRHTASPGHHMSIAQSCPSSRPDWIPVPQQRPQETCTSIWSHPHLCPISPCAGVSRLTFAKPT